MSDNHCRDEESFDGFHFSARMTRSEMRAANEAMSTPAVHGEGYVSQEDYERLDKICALSEAFEDVLFWCWNAKCADGTYKVRKFKSAQNHFVALTALVRPDTFEKMSYEEIGKKIGVTKQRMSAMAKSFQIEFGLKFRRSHTATNKHSEAAKESWQKEDRIKTWKKDK